MFDKHHVLRQQINTKNPIITHATILFTTRTIIVPETNATINEIKQSAINSRLQIESFNVPQSLWQYLLMLLQLIESGSYLSNVNCFVQAIEFTSYT